MSISTEFAGLLRAGRPQFNARVAEARQRYPGLNTETLSHFLQNCVDPVVVKVDAAQRGLVASAAFDIALDLVGRELAGAHARGAQLESLWKEALPALAIPLASRPTPLLSALCNALLNLQALPATRPEQWLQLMRDHGGTLRDADALLQFGVLAAWRSGAAHFRLPALRAAAQLPELSCLVLGIPQSQHLTASLRVLEQNPWLLAKQGSLLNVGAFTGFGGHFSEPPQVRASNDVFFVKSGDRYFLLIADCFGSVLLPADKAEYDGASSGASDTNALRLDGARLVGPKASVNLSLPAADLQLAWNAHSAAVTSPYSFSIFVAPWA